MQALGRVVGHLGETDAARTAILDLDCTDNDDLALVTAPAATGHRTMLAVAGDLGFVDLDQSGVPDREPQRPEGRLRHEQQI
jgi:hypothetical protein